MHSDKVEAALRVSWNCRLTTRGRSSGKPRSVTIWYAHEGDVVYLTGGSDESHWCRNIRAFPDVELAIGTARLKGKAVVIDDEAEASAIRQRFVERYLLARLSQPFGGYTASTAVRVELDPA